ncbi:MAG: penicillin acylase family protein [Gemmatimonadaceae bacterium]|jgi:penicillin amidase|nr:penicillin acylase family protein [Gemmatimonadaceae bacterium]
MPRLVLPSRTAHSVLAALVIAAWPSARAVAQATESIPTRGLRAPVTLRRDSAGVVHIRARNEHDLFFAQGWSAARDRLFQLELWRRQATGTLAEVLGSAAVPKDIASRAFRFRGNLSRELAHYHPRGAAIIGAFVEGINAYIGETEKNVALLSPEFGWLGWRPGRWTPAIVISRHNGLSQNADSEIELAQAVATLGAERAARLLALGPEPVTLALDSMIDPASLATSGVARFLARTAPVPWSPAHVAPEVRRTASLDQGAPELADSLRKVESNNWVIAGTRTASGKPILANDPHRAITAPSLRYFVHLEAPGWNVIGGGEPSLPGISIGHNAHGAWGLTIFGLDTEDVYVYRVRTGAVPRYWYRGAWIPMRVERERIRVRGAPDTVVTQYFTRHGPVTAIDTVRGMAYAVRAAWLDIGGAPYLASLRFAQARTWREFRAATAFHRMPAENLIWADTSGTIGWQAVGFAPVREGWTGLLPVPGDGRYEWKGYLPILQLPSIVDPVSGHLATANENNVPPGYPHVNAVGRQWAEPWRVQRVREVLDTTRGATASSMAALQQDVTSIVSRRLATTVVRRAPTACPGPGVTPSSRTKAGCLLQADPSGRLAPTSATAAVLVALERALLARNREAVFADYDDPALRSLATSVFFAWLDTVRVSVIEEALGAVGDTLTRRFGPDPAAWRYGDAAFKHVLIRHTLANVVDSTTRARLQAGPLPRGGAQHTINMTGAGDNQTSGASFRVVLDAGDWDRSLATNAPGQSGDVRGTHYRDLFADWVAGRYFPLPYSAAAVARRTESVTTLRPR